MAEDPNVLIPFGRRPNDPAREAFDITPSDTVDVPGGTRGLYVGVSGNVKVTMIENKGTVTLLGLAAGIVHPLAVSRVWATGTGATSIVGFR